MQTATHDLDQKVLYQHNRQLETLNIARHMYTTLVNKFVYTYITLRYLLEDCKQC